MIWLIIHDWLLLLLAFLLGLLIGWWIWHRRSIEDNRDAYAERATLTNAPEPVASAPTKTEPDLPTKTSPTPTPQTPTSQTPDLPSGTAPKLYTTASDGPADDLKKIKGIGPNYEKLLNEIGIYYYRQISNWTPDEIAWLDNKLEFPGRIVRDQWQQQASTLDKGGVTEFATRYDSGDTPSSYKDNGPEDA